MGWQDWAPRKWAELTCLQALQGTGVAGLTQLLKKAGWGHQWELRPKLSQRLVSDLGSAKA